MEFINLCNDDYPLWEVCKENGWTDLSYDEWYERDGALAFFEGDPDMIRFNNWVGYFAECDGKVFYYFDDFTGEVEQILRAFFDAFETGVTIGGYSYAHGEKPKGVATVEGGWDAWEKIEVGIAFRGGAGYTYWLTDWSEWLKNAA